MSEDKKTILRLEIDKTIQPKTYEPIKIQISVEESFFWGDEKDRTNKMKCYIEKITKDFITSFNHVVTKIGEEDRCIGLVTSNGVSPSKGKEKIDTDSSVTEEEWNFN